MTPQETLQKAVEIAVKNGWNNIVSGYVYVPENEWFVREIDVLDVYTDLYTVIFNKDFAKALWPQKEHITNYFEDGWVKHRINWHVNQKLWIGDDLDFTGEEWQYHLQQMVIAPDPIEYLAANLPDEKE